MNKYVEELTELSKVSMLCRWRRKVSVKAGRRRRGGRTGRRGEDLPWSARDLIQVRQVSEIGL